MKKRWWLLAWFLISAALFAKVMHEAGELATLKSHAASKCTLVAGMPGAEDITFHPTLGYAYVSSDDRRASLAKRPVQGGIYRFDPSRGTRVLLTGSFKQPFHPHGMSLFVDGQGKQTLFVINHPSMGVGQVEKFELGREGLLQHKKTLRDAALVSPNDLAAVDSERFYVTNDHDNPFGLRQLFEDLLQLIGGNSFAEGSVVYFNGERFREVVSDTAYANGINCTRDGKTVYLAQALAKTLTSYDRDESSGALSLRQVVRLGTGPDNVELDQTGALWIGAHPKALAFVRHALDKSGATPAPAQVLRVRLQGKRPMIEEIYLSEGKPLSAVATAAVHGKHMLLGPVFDAQLLSCQLP